MANSSNITKRIDVGRPLQWVEADANFEQLKLIINEYNTLQPIGDAPSDTNQYVRLNGSWSQLQTTNPAWGQIDGTLANQTDLQNELDGLQQGIDGNASNINTNTQAINDLGDAIARLTPISVAGVLVINTHYLLTSNNTFTLPDTTNLNVGDQVTVTPTYGNTPTVQVDGTNLEEITTKEGPDTSILFDSVNKVQFVFTGSGWEV